MEILKYKEHINEEYSKNDPIPEFRENSKLGIILTGAPGAGKSTFAMNEIKRKMKNVKIFSTDDVSRTLLGGSSEEYVSGSSELNIKRLFAFMESGQNFVYDTTATNDRVLLRVKEESKKYGYKLMFVHIIVDLETAKKQNKERSEKGGHNVDDGFIEMVYKRQFHNMKIFNDLLKPDAYYVAMNMRRKWKYFKLRSNRLHKRKVDKYVPVSN